MIMKTDHEWIGTAIANRRKCEDSVQGRCPSTEEAAGGYWGQGIGSTFCPLRRLLEGARDRV